MKLPQLGRMRAEPGATQRNLDAVVTHVQALSAALSSLVSTDVWAPVTLANIWDASTSTLRVAKRVNRVFFRGSAVLSSSGNLVCSVAAKFRPTAPVVLACAVYDVGAASNAPAVISVGVSGNMTVDSPSISVGSVIYLDGVSFEVG